MSQNQTLKIKMQNHKSKFKKSDLPAQYSHRFREPVKSSERALCRTAISFGFCIVILIFAFLYLIQLVIRKGVILIQQE